MITFRTPAAEAAAPVVIDDTPVGRMAEAMRVIAGGGRTVDREALQLEGFSEAEIDRYGVEARDLANARSRSRAA